MEETYENATLGGGCFWCTEAVFQRLKGIIKIESGYCGGRVPQPTYREICTGTTGHAEVIQITFDPRIISFEQILDVFFATHDPTTLNRQGNDSGTQYRSVIFYHNAAQSTEAERAVIRNQPHWPEPIVTEIAPVKVFYKAEANHQNYYSNNNEQPYCVFVITPKLKKIEEYLSNL